MAAVYGCTNSLATNYAPLAQYDDGTCILPKVMHHNITGVLTQELLAPGSNANISSISLTNIEGTNIGTVDLYIEKKLTGKYYLLKDTSLPVGVTLLYDNVNFNNATGEFGLYIKLAATNGTPAVDVILR